MKPFTNGEQYERWSARNCDNCASYGTTETNCPIALALICGYLGDGSVAPEIAERMGTAEQCGEFVAQ